MEWKKVRHQVRRHPGSLNPLQLIAVALAGLESNDCSLSDKLQYHRVLEERPCACRIMVILLCSTTSTAGELMCHGQGTSFC